MYIGKQTGYTQDQTLNFYEEAKRTNRPKRTQGTTKNVCEKSGIELYMKLCNKSKKGVGQFHERNAAMIEEVMYAIIVANNQVRE